MEIKVWGIIEGPIHTDEIDEIENDEEGWFMVCKSEIDGKIESATFYFNDLDDAYEWKKHFDKSIEPLIVEQNKEHLI